jgi:hypothetical protein
MVEKGFKACCIWRYISVIFILPSFHTSSTSNLLIQNIPTAPFSKHSQYPVLN